MCFSATASFSSGVVLTIVGIASLRKAGRSRRLAFAAIPFIFAIQQFSEGFVWLSLTDPAFVKWQSVPAYIFLTFAHIVWPIWIPFSILLLEKNLRRKNLLYMLFGAGMVLGSYYIYCLASYPIAAVVDGYHIRYHLNYPAALFAITTVFYGLATILPSFISSIGRMKVLGISITISYIATAFFYSEYITSVWCYFAALLSITVYWILYGHQQKITLNNIALKIKTQV